MQHKVDSDVLLQRARSLRTGQTIAEKVLWGLLRAKRFNNIKFARQVPIGNHIADFCCFSHHLIIEVDGGQHDEGYERDMEGQNPSRAGDSRS